MTDPDAGADWYVLDDDHRPVRATLDQWIEYTRKHGRHVAHTDLGPVGVSTLFLGIEMGLGELFGAEPMFFETAVIGPKGVDVLRKHATWHQAQAYHAAIVRHIKRKCRCGLQKNETS